MERTDTMYTAKDITLTLDIGDSTLRKWCLSLEEHEYIFYRTDQNKRLFTERDIIVLKHYQHLVKEKNMSMKNAALIVTSKYKKMPFSDGTEIEQLENEMNPAIYSGETTDIQQLVKTMQENIVTEIMEKVHKPMIQEFATKVQAMEAYQKRLEDMNLSLMNQLETQTNQIQHFIQETASSQEEKTKQQYERLLNSVPQPSSPEEERAQRIDEMITRRRIESQLEKEALAKWNAKPEEERIIKVGLFRKEEDKDKRDQFVKEYINTHFESRVRKEYDIK